MLDLSIIFSNTVAGIIVQLPTWIILYICARVIGRAIITTGKKVPAWIEQYFELKNHEDKIKWATKGQFTK